MNKHQRHELEGLLGLGIGSGDWGLAPGTGLTGSGDWVEIGSGDWVETGSGDWRLGVCVAVCAGVCVCVCV